MKNEESREQSTLIKWAELSTAKHPELRLLFAIPNGGKRNVITAMNMKREGVKPGVPDLFLAYPSKGFHGLFIEMKKRKGGTVSEAQHWWHQMLSTAGYQVRVCKGWEESRAIIEQYLTKES
jgi:hypothetical protein